MEIKILRRILSMSQQKFANYFGIPIGTIRNWEQGVSNPPEYVYNMINKIIRRDKMINIETIKFIKVLDKLAEMSLNGIEPFENATEETFNNILFYNKKTEEQSEDNTTYKLVMDACIVDNEMCYHHDIKSYYDTEEYTVRVVFQGDAHYIEIRFVYNDELIIIEKGKWYIA